MASFQTKKSGAGTGNRTRTKCLGSICDTVSPCPQVSEDYSLVAIKCQIQETAVFLHFSLAPLLFPPIMTPSQMLKFSEF